MTGVRVVERSEIGREVLEKVMRADNGRKDWTGFFTERVESDRPYRIVVEHRNRVARKVVPGSLLVEVIRKQLEALGVREGTDYDLEVLG